FDDDLEVTERLQRGVGVKALVDGLLEWLVQNTAIGEPSFCGGLFLEIPLLSAQYEIQSGCTATVNSKETRCSKESGEGGRFQNGIVEINSPDRHQYPGEVFQDLAGLGRGFLKV